MTDSAKDYVYPERSSDLDLLATIGPNDDRVYAVLKKAVFDRKESESVRRVAMLCLAKMGKRGQVIIPELMHILKETEANKLDDSFLLRWDTIRALSKLKLSPEQVPAVIAIAVDPNEDSLIRPDAVKALVHSSEVAQAAWRPLFRLLQDDGPRPPALRGIVVALREIDPPADADRAALASDLRTTFDRILQRCRDDDLAEEMDRTVKAVRKR